MKIAGVVGLLALSVTSGAVAQQIQLRPYLHHADPLTLPRSLKLTFCGAERKAAGMTVIRMTDIEDTANVRVIIGTFDSTGAVRVLQVFVPTQGSVLATFDSLLGPSGNAEGLVLPPRMYPDSDYARVRMSDTALARARELGRWLWNSWCNRVRVAPGMRST